jgi:hypothetical protein
MFVYLIKINVNLVAWTSCMYVTILFLWGIEVNCKVTE